jgi:P27 family predicted phage terminase small subunit
MPANLMRTSSGLTAIKSKPAAELAKIPKMPDSIGADMGKDYKTLIGSLIAAGTWRENLMPTVEMYLSSVSMLREAQRVLNVEGHYYVGPDGTPKAHPAASAISKAVAAMNSATRLLGINVGSADAMAKTAETSVAETTKPASKWSA